MADHLFRNNWTRDELFKKVSNVLGNRGPGIEKYIRPTWDQYFMEIAVIIAKRGTCDLERNGAVIAKDKQILVTGYVGSPRGMPHCDDVGHQMEEWENSDGIKRMRCIRTTHAEQNAVCQAAKLGISIEGATLYCTAIPCQACSKMIINAGIKRVICEKTSEFTGEIIKLFNQAEIQLDILNSKS